MALLSGCCWGDRKVVPARGGREVHKNRQFEWDVQDREIASTPVDCKLKGSTKMRWTFGRRLVEEGGV